MDERQRAPETAGSEQDEEPGLGDHARELKREFSTAKLSETLDEAVKERPLLDHLLDIGIVLRAVAIGVIGALILWLLIGPGAAAVALVVLFLGSWYGLAQRSYDQRRPTRPAHDRDDSEE